MPTSKACAKKPVLRYPFVMFRALQKSQVPKTFKLTARDIQIIRGVHQFRLLNTDQIMQLTNSRDRSRINERLRLLFDWDYLDRPEIQKAYQYDKGRPLIHALNQRGAEWLHQNDKARFPKKMSWKQANNFKSITYVEHELGIPSTMLSIKAEIEELDAYRIIYAKELNAVGKLPPSRSGKPTRLPTAITLANGELVTRSTDPDFTFGLGKRILDVSEEGSEAILNEKRALFFLEFDNHTESLVKTNKRDSAILQKYLCYVDAYKRKLHQQRYNIDHFRVLFVVPDDARLASMLHIFQTKVAHLCPPSIFLHTTTGAELHAQIQPDFTWGKTDLRDASELRMGQ